MSVDGNTVTVAVGSGHGLLAPIVAEAALSVYGNFCPVKRVEVDHMVIERPTGVSISAGDSVGVLGRGGVPVEQWATWCGTIGDEVLVHLSANIPRTWAD
jgi:alanine racemase